MKKRVLHFLPQMEGYFLRGFTLVCFGGCCWGGGGCPFFDQRRAGLYRNPPTGDHRDPVFVPSTLSQGPTAAMHGTWTLVDRVLATAISLFYQRIQPAHRKRTSQGRFSPAQCAPVFLVRTLVVDPAQIRDQSTRPPPRILHRTFSPWSHLRLPTPPVMPFFLFFFFFLRPFTVKCRFMAGIPAFAALTRTLSLLHFDESDVHRPFPVSSLSLSWVVEISGQNYALFSQRHRSRGVSYAPPRNGDPE